MNTGTVGSVSMGGVDKAITLFEPVVAAHPGTPEADIQPAFSATCQEAS